MDGWVGRLGGFGGLYQLERVPSGGGRVGLAGGAL